jgi:hypothetical protein
MSHTRRSFRTRKLVILLAGLGLAAIIGAKYAKYLWSDSESLSTSLDRRSLPQEPPDPFHLQTKSGSLDQSHIVDGDFNIVTRMSEITTGCRQIFDGSFVNFSGSAASNGQVLFADPGQDFEAIDAIRGGLPYRFDDWCWPG